MRTSSPPSRHSPVSPRTLRLPALVLLGLAVLLVAPPPSAAVTIDWVPIRNPANAADTPSSNCFSASCGSVSYEYQISRYEVTNAQYAEFLNAVAATDTNTVYGGCEIFFSPNCGITRSGVSGSFSYSVNTGFANKPVNFVSFYDSLRFTNWLNNGQGGADTETGAYTITPTGITDNTITRNALANTFLPSENEWYKAAYYDPVSTSYFDYPTGTDTRTTCSGPTATANSANCFNPAHPEPPGYGRVTDVGAYTGSASPYGTYDQGGNVFEWNEQIVLGSRRGLRGGGIAAPPDFLAARLPIYSVPLWWTDNIGFRVASPIPEPGTGLLVMMGLAGLAVRRRRPAQAL